MDYRARFYSSSLGRFIQPDTITPDMTQGLNRYSYVNNNPINFNDPSGHARCDEDGNCMEGNRITTDIHARDYGRAYEYSPVRNHRPHASTKPLHNPILAPFLTALPTPGSPLLIAGATATPAGSWAMYEQGPTTTSTPTPRPTFPSPLSVAKSAGEIIEDAARNQEPFAPSFDAEMRNAGACGLKPLCIAFVEISITINIGLTILKAGFGISDQIRDYNNSQTPFPQPFNGYPPTPSAIPSFQITTPSPTATMFMFTPTYISTPQP